VQDRFPDKKITREHIRAMRRPLDGRRLPSGRRRGKKVTASPL
jgi:hypothetical protein